MARRSTRKPRGRHFTPPPGLHTSSGHVKTPQRCGVLFAKAFSQELGIPISQALVRKVTGVAKRVQRRILATKQTRTLHNRNDGRDPRGRKRAMTRSDTAAIGNFLTDETVPLNDRGAPWLDVAEAAGVTLPETTHFKPYGRRVVTPQAVQRACKIDEDIINAKCEEDRLLKKEQAEARLDWVNEQLSARPRSRYWKDVAFCDEYHLELGCKI
jgi:hypothetical protein